MKSLIILSCLLMGLQSSTLHAQNEELKNFYDREAIAFYGDSKFMKNNDVMPRKKIRPLLLQYDVSAAEYKQFQKRRTIGNIIAISAAAIYVGSIAMLGTNPEVAIGMLGGSVAAAFVSVPFQLKAQKNLQRSVHLYNREVLAKK
jgi:hypothetical protein